MNTNVCIPVLRCYDLLHRLLLSLRESTVPVNRVWIIDNGKNESALRSAVAETLTTTFTIHTPKVPRGVAESWNWFIGRTSENRIITNDDMVFAPQSLERMIATPGDLSLGFGFSCYLFRDSAIGKVGLFDEQISPGYAYFEDADYIQRIRQTPSFVMSDAQGTGLIHGDGKDGSCTYRAGTQEEIDEHWRKYRIAHGNFVKKHGAPPEVLEELWKNERRAFFAEAVAQ